MIYQEQATIIKNKQIAPDIHEITLDIPKITNLIQPGQFLHVKITAGSDPLLRRPLSVCRLLKKKNQPGFFVVILYKVVGKGTKILSEQAAGCILDVLGPLGNGFSLGQANERTDSVFLVAGGMGIAPLYYLAQTLIQAKKEVIIFTGAATKKDIVYVREFKQLGCKVKIATDDGSLGFKGYVSELVKNYLSNSQDLTSPGEASLKQPVARSRHYSLSAVTWRTKPYIYACGPLPMLGQLHKIAGAYKFDGQVSVDKMMGCGVGACLGCVIKIKKEKSNIKNDFVYKRICKDGPVFDIKELVWEE